MFSSSSSSFAALRELHVFARPPRLTKLALHPPKALYEAYLDSTRKFWKHTTQLPRQRAFLLSGIFDVKVEFSDGSSFNLSAEFLRVHSPAVDSKIRSIGGEKVIFGRRHVGIMSAEPIGNYGIRILFDDLHKTGIYTWDYLYHLGSNKFAFMRSYIKTLKQHGLSRDPQRRK